MSAAGTRPYDPVIDPFLEVFNRARMGALYESPNRIVIDIPTWGELCIAADHLHWQAGRSSSGAEVTTTSKETT
jgi:hypothetical protein